MALRRKYFNILWTIYIAGDVMMKENGKIHITSNDNIYTGPQLRDRKPLFPVIIVWMRPHAAAAPGE